MRKAAALGLALLLLAIGVTGCGSDSESTQSPTLTLSGPTPPPGWQSFAAAENCITFAYPPDWRAVGSGDLETTGEQRCPGGTLVGIPGECTDEAVQEGATLFVAASNDSAMTLSLAVSKLRCATLQEFFGAMAGQVIRTANATVLEEHMTTTFGDYQAICQRLEYTLEARLVHSHVCAIKVGPSFYRLFGIYNADSDVGASTISEVEGSLRFRPIVAASP
jgi:hypothetical protein